MCASLWEQYRNYILKVGVLESALFHHTSSLIMDVCKEITS